jgi:hypothetical protein
MQHAGPPSGPPSLGKLYRLPLPHPSYRHEMIFPSSHLLILETYLIVTLYLRNASRFVNICLHSVIRGFVWRCTIYRTWSRNLHASPCMFISQMSVAQSNRSYRQCQGRRMVEVGHLSLTLFVFFALFTIKDLLVQSEPDAKEIPIIKMVSSTFVGPTLKFLYW